MRKVVFRLLARVNKLVLPSLWRKDPRRLNTMQRALVAWRYWVTRNAL